MNSIDPDIYTIVLVDKHRLGYDIRKVPKQNKSLENVVLPCIQGTSV